MNKNPNCLNCGQKLTLIATRQSPLPETSYWLCEKCQSIHEATVYRKKNGTMVGHKWLKVTAEFEDDHYVKPD